MSAANEQQISDWNGATGARWLANQEWLDRSLSTYGAAALTAARARPGEAVLDIGCGAGATTLDLARQVLPGGTMVAVDISEPLIGRARERAKALELAIDFKLADASAHPFKPAAFDLLFSRFGVMFFDDPVAAFSHLRETLRAGGRLAFVCWRSMGENDWFKVPLGAVLDILPPLPPAEPFAPGPFAFGDRRRVDGILRQAGFANVAFAPFDAPVLLGLGETRQAAVDDAVDQALRVGPLPRLLAEQTDDLRERATAAIRKALAGCATADGVAVFGAAWIVTATA
ncbi:class I SAM-dependent methyltransferase [Phreatobacter stygius]|uniref:Class I SAM-dependent methyltransferase n=1 Tax=Phreatobacter stygius TaxID=1940610 RepID=A0A4D7B1J5_9HYPH|nr:class I SAM-dependent methyltransferase [Phreatobacter stygius]QCI64843.1 class I SAM-dependent methyltransferase [Phreatobacter stygius]